MESEMWRDSPFTPPIGEGMAPESIVVDEPVVEQRMNPVLKKAFNDAEKQITKMIYSEEFKDRCIELNISPTDPGHPIYWGVIRAQGKELAEVWRPKDRPSMRADVVELVTATPAFMFDQLALDRYTMGGDTRQLVWEAVVDYHGVMKRFVKGYHWMPVEDLLVGLSEIIDMVAPTEAVAKTGINYLDNAIYKARHRVAYAKLLKLAGCVFDHATPEQSTWGVDFVMEEHGKPTLFVGVTDSSHHLKGQGKDQDFAIITGYGKPRVAKVVTPLTDDELGDKLQAPLDLLQERAQSVLPVLSRVRAVIRDR